MIKEVFFLSAKKAAALRPNANTIVVSILDSSEERNRPVHLEEFKAQLSLQFFDAQEMDWEEHWPDQMSSEQHRQACGLPGERAPEMSDAVRIADFLDHHAKSPEEVTLVVHCFAGISRSAAVAEFAASAHGAQLPQLDSDDWLVSTSGANKRLLRLLHKAAQKK